MTTQATTTTDSIFFINELNRVLRCVDFRFESKLKKNATFAIENIALACVSIKISGLKSSSAIAALNTADAAIEELREDIKSIKANLRRPFLDNCDDAQGSIRSIISLA